MRKQIFALGSALVAIAIASSVTHAQGALFEKEVIVSAEDFASRAPPPADPSALVFALTDAVLRASNHQRALAGLPALAGDIALDQAAARYSRKMRNFNFFDHIAPDGETLDQRVDQSEAWRFQAFGENLWSGQGALDWRAEALATEAAANWIESPGHRANLLDPSYTLGGVGAAMGGDQLYITMLYATPFTDQGEARLLRDHGKAPSDLTGFSQTLAQRIIATINMARAEIGLPAINDDPILSQTARSHSDAMLMGRFLSSQDQSGVSVFERALEADTGRFRRLAAGFWRGSGSLIWQEDAVSDQIVDTWRGNAVNWNDALDPGFSLGGIGISTDGTTLLVTVLFGEAGV